MRSRISAGLLMYRYRDGQLQVFLAHPGGPLFRNKDDGYWSLPKGEPDSADEALLETALREFEEETGICPAGPFTELGSIIQKGGKTVYAWAFEGEWDDTEPIRCNTFAMEWPPRSGRMQSFPEIDRGRFFGLEEARLKVREDQWPLVQRLIDLIGPSSSSA
jgi:predicted NUDIX family NTP pyrophosphohydrolase